MGGSDHRCEWREKAESLEAQLAAAAARLGEATNTITALHERVTSLQSTVEKLQRHVYGQRSEKMPRVSDEIRDATTAEADREAALQKRRENAAKKRELPTRRIEHKIPEDRKVCPKCGGHDFTPLGGGKVTEVYELVPARIERQLHVQEKVRCRCGETIITADPPAKVFDKTRFGPTFMAQVAVAKCADSIPLYRQAKAYRRAGVPVDDSTLGDLFHRTAEILGPLYIRLLELVPKVEIVLADETTMRVLAKKKTRTAWIWSFIARDPADKELIAYVYSKSRSGETPVRVLADTIGKLLVDGYSAYNKVTVPGGRERAGCMAHLRRKFFEAQSAAPEAARKAMDFILEIYKVERAALDNEVLGAAEHLALRQTRSKPVIGLDPVSWTPSERRLRCPTWQRGRASGGSVGPSPTSSGQVRCASSSTRESRSARSHATST